MNKHIQKIKKQAADEAMKAGLVIVGAVGGLALAKGIRKFTESKPSLDGIAKYATPVLLAGGGFILAAATDKDSKIKYLGYGLAVAGTIEGVKLIPVASELLFGILGDASIPSASAYYSEGEARRLVSGFGLAALPVGDVDMQEAIAADMNLPDLEGNDDVEISGLGYNSGMTDDVDPRVNGII